jgi:transposase
MDELYCLREDNEHLRQENEHLRQENRELRERLGLTETRLKELTGILGQNSRNSSWPSSRDKGRQKPKPKSLRRKTERQAGGQAGHEGHTLQFNPEPDVVERHRPDCCAGCGEAFPEALEASAIAKRQILDLPPLHYVTTEHQVETVICPCCGVSTSEEFPPGVTNPVQYGSQVKRLAVYLRTEQFVPYERAQQLLSDLFGLSLSPGSLQNFVEGSAETVKPAVEAIKLALMKAEVAHADETGFYVKGKRSWLHTVSTGQLTCYEPHEKRGKEATDTIGILPAMTGTLVHDAWAPYFRYEQLLHSLCNAHHLRDLTGVAENDGQLWATLMVGYLSGAMQLVCEAKGAGETALQKESLEYMHQLYDAIVQMGLEENPLPEPGSLPKKRGRPKKTKGRNLAERFAKHKTDILRFAHDFRVPFDNNLAERDIRMMKVQQKISGCFRSWDGARQFCRLRSYISTIRKQGLNVWDALGSLFEGDILMPHLTPV